MVTLTFIFLVAVLKLTIWCPFNESFLLCGVKTLTDNTTVTQPATCSFSFLLVCLPLAGGTCTMMDMARRQGPYFRKLVLLYKKVYLHTNDFANEKLSGFAKEMRSLKLMKACEMSKLNALEENMFTVNSEYNYCRIFRF